MILKASQRGGSRQLAAHLLNMVDNDHVELLEVKGFAASDLAGALEEAHAVSKGTKAEQFLFSLSMNPPRDQEVGIDEFSDVAKRAGKAVGLDGQPFVLVVHEKEGRRHAHAVWSRIDADQMKAINLPYFKDRLNELSKELYLEHGWELPNGHRENGWANPLNFTLGEFQQAKRLGLDPREVKQLFREAWENSDNGQSFKAALEQRGYSLARGDQRGFVAVDLQGEVYSLSRQTGVKTKELEERLGSPKSFPSVDEVRLDTRTRVDRKVREFHRNAVRDLGQKRRPLLEEKRVMVLAHREERARLVALQEERRIRENRERHARIRTGIRGLLDMVIGRAAAIRRINEREALEGSWRDRDQRESVFRAQGDERRELQDRIDNLRREHRTIIMQIARKIGESLNPPQQAIQQVPVQILRRERGNDDDFGL